MSTPDSTVPFAERSDVCAARSADIRCKEMLANIWRFDGAILATESAQTKHETDLVSLELDRVGYKSKRQRLLCELEGEYQQVAPTMDLAPTREGALEELWSFEW